MIKYSITDNQEKNKTKRVIYSQHTIFMLGQLTNQCTNGYKEFQNKIKLQHAGHSIFTSITITKTIIKKKTNVKSHQMCKSNTTTLEEKLYCNKFHMQQNDDK